MNLGLASLPPEILDLVLSYPSSSHVLLRLWKCGDSLLTSKLVRGITKVVLRADKLSSNKMPALLFQLPSLRHLHVSSDYLILSNGEECLSFFKKLPSTLETIRFQILEPSSHSAFAFIPFETPDKGKCIDVGPVFPRLTDISLYHCYGPLTSQLRTLPPTLTRLTDSFSIMASSFSVMRHLPRTLTDLDTPVVVSRMKPDREDDFRQDWLLIPPHLAIIDTVDLTDSRIKSDWIPRHLKIRTLQIGTVSSIMDLPPNVDEMLIMKWMNYETLFQTHPKASWPSLLPSKLQTLSIFGADHSVNVLFDLNIAQLPRTLTKLQLDATAKIDWPALTEANTAKPTQTIEATSLWPPTLTHLCADLYGLEKEIIEALPRSLKVLEVLVRDGSLLNKKISIPASIFPPELDTLDINIKVDILILDFKGELPPSLTLLRVYKLRPFASDDHRYESLPIGLLEFSTENILAPLAESLRWRLPSTLTKLEPTYWPIALIKELPPTLTYLVTTFFGLADIDSDAAKTIFMDLPTSTVTFEADHEPFASKLEFSPLSFSRLLKLERLVVHSDLGLFPPSTLRHLSSELIHVRMPISNGEFTFLPPQLKRFFFYREIPFDAEMWPLRTGSSIYRDGPEEFVSAFESRKRSLLYH